MVLGQLTPLEQTRAAQELISQGITQGISQGISLGLEKGVIAGQIIALEGILGLEPAKVEELQQQSLETLNARLQQVRSKFRDR